VFAYLAKGAFTIGDLSPGLSVLAPSTFWGSKWTQANAMSGGSGPSSYKGFAASLTPPGAGTTWCVGGGWATDTGNSSPPPSSVPSYMAVVVSSTVKSSSSTVFSSPQVPEVVVVKTSPGYSGAPGATGMGTVVAVVCHS